MVDIFTGIFFIIFSVFVLFMLRGYPHFSIKEGMGPASLPMLYSIGIIIMSVILIFFSILKLRKEKRIQKARDPNNISPGSPASGSTKLMELEKLKEIAILVLVLVIYLLALRPLGFLITTPIMVFMVMKRMGATIRSSIVAGVLFTAVTYVLFKIFLGVLIPGLPSFI